MRYIDQDTRIDDDGHLYLRVSPMPDTFDPPGYLPPPAWTPTGFYYADVPTYGWPLGAIWKIDSLEFPTAETANKIAAIIRATLGDEYSVRVYEQEVRVGPYSWRGLYKIGVIAPGGRELRPLNAGLEASTYARYPQEFRAKLVTRLGA